MTITKLKQLLIQLIKAPGGQLHHLSFGFCYIRHNLLTVAPNNVEILINMTSFEIYGDLQREWLLNHPKVDIQEENMGGLFHGVLKYTDA